MSNDQNPVPQAPTTPAVSPQAVVAQPVAAPRKSFSTTAKVSVVAAAFSGLLVGAGGVSMLDHHAMRPGVQMYGHLSEMRGGRSADMGGASQQRAHPGMRSGRPQRGAGQGSPMPDMQRPGADADGQVGQGGGAQPQQNPGSTPQPG